MILQIIALLCQINLNTTDINLAIETLNRQKSCASQYITCVNKISSNSSGKRENLLEQCILERSFQIK